MTKIDSTDEINIDLRDQDRQQLQQQQQNANNDKQTQGICLLFLSAFSFSFMGMFLQFTAKMGIPSTELVFIRSVFQGIFVITGMIFFRFDDCPTKTDSSSSDSIIPKHDAEAGYDNGVDMLLIHDELSNEGKKPREEVRKLEDAYGYIVSPEKAPLLAESREMAYSSLAPSEVPRGNDIKSSPNATATLPRRIIQAPFGTTPAMIRIVILRGFIGGFGFINYYYTLSTLPLGDATTLLSLYPIVTIFLARFVLGEEIKPLHLLAAVFSVTGAALISRPSFIFGYEDDDSRPPKLGYVTALIGSMCASCAIVLIRKAGRMGAHTLQLLFSWMVLSISLSLLIGFIAASNTESQQWRTPSREEMPYVLGVCVTGTFAHFLLNYAAKLIPATLAGLIKSSDIFYAYVLEIIVLDQHPQKATYWGVMLICFSLASVLFASKEKTGSKMKHLQSVGNLTAAK